ncbi:transporter substrate-binding domain-containing protein [Paracoccus sp. MBLB3053]|uniref:Transporter substrate-binding domain-containing protein n=1 Tax=Paracoccus aurantius TaxID=3073814 RepID=A0ABU2HX45_9RHOB|nr:transporter substrate-binding domain-containing protein [Paracoccus sp. MBLB3053]MDS9469179.1 transporter substrate-binding domain-containing protein [Paracoccus sp. MBLB3053]
MNRLSHVLRIACVTASLVATGAHANTLAKIESSHQVTVGTEAAFPPFEFVQDGRIVGYGKDILDLVAERLGVSVEQLDVPFSGILPGLDASKFDFVATSVGMTEERVKNYAFTYPIAVSSEVILKRADDGSISSVANLEGKVVGTQLGTTTQEEAEKANASLKAKGGKGFADLKLYPSFPEAYLALTSGEIDAVVQSMPNAAALTKEKPDVFAVAGPVTDAQRYIAWVTRASDTDLRDRISVILKELRDSGKLYELQQKWFGFTMALPDGDYLPAGGI